jgi:hypothetical protein
MGITHLSVGRQERRPIAFLASTLLCSPAEQAMELASGGGSACIDRFLQQHGRRVHNLSTRTLHPGHLKFGKRLLGKKRLLLLADFVCNKQHSFRAHKSVKH